MLLKTYHNNLNAFSLCCCGLNINHLTRIYRNLYIKYKSNHGRKYAVKHMKNINSICERYALYQSIDPLNFRKSYKDGYPKELRDFKPYLRDNNPYKVKMVLSIFRSVELLRLEPDHDISTVKQQPTYELEVIKDIIRFIPQFASKFPKLRYRDLFYHYTVKNGPNGPALMSSDTDFASVRDDTKLFKSLKYISEVFEDTNLPPDEHVPDKTGIHSRLTQFSEKSGKTRTIAVVDYYSQRALRPLHSSLMNLLGNLESDGTYNQNNVGNYTLEATKNKSFIATSDMTAFTDLFPAILQQKLLRCLEPNRDLTNSFWTLLKKRTFRVAWSGEYVNYGTGQPMGAYASWAICTLAHHMIVHYCAHKLQIKGVNGLYRIIGDDNVITNKAISLLYEETLKAIGCKLNPSKGTKSNKDAENSGAEVAKRLYLNGINLSPLTPGILNNIANPNTANAGLNDLLIIYENQALPIQILKKFFRNEKLDKVLILCTNPFTGVIKPGFPGYEYRLQYWGNDETASYLYYLKDIIVRLRQSSLNDKVNQIISDNIGPYGSFARMTVKSTLKDDSGQSGNDTVPQWAQVECRRHLLKLFKKAMEEVDNINVNNVLDLTEVEYLPDPRNPFLDRKVIRETHASLLIEKCYHLSLSEKDVSSND